MELMISFEGSGVDPGDVDRLDEWLADAKLSDTSIGRKKAEAGEGEMASGLEILTVVLAAPVIVNSVELLIRSIHEWIRTRVNTTTVKILRPDGTGVELSNSSANTKDLETFLQMAERLAAK